MTSTMTPKKKEDFHIGLEVHLMDHHGIHEDSTCTIQQSEHASEMKDNSAKGFTFMLLYVLFTAMFDATTKIIFINQPGVGIMQFILARGIL